jgi:type III secretion protein L
MSMEDITAAASKMLPTGPGKKVLRSEELRAWQDGFWFLEKARQTAEQIVASAQRAYDAERTRGYKDGYAAGAYEATLLVTRTTVQVDRRLDTLEQQICDLVLTIVRQILGYFDREDVVALAASAALPTFRREKSVTVAVHPDTADHVRATLTQYVQAASLGIAINVEPRQGLSLDGCILSSEYAVIDASIEVQLKAIEVALTEPPLGNEHP